jgi:hypothetical protein
MTAFPYSQYAHGTYRPGTRANSDMLSGDLFAQLAAQQRRNEARYAELLHEISVRIGYEAAMLYLDELPEMGGNEMIATLEAKLAALDAEVTQAIEAASPCPHASTIDERDDETGGYYQVCAACGEVMA